MVMMWPWTARRSMSATASRCIMATASTLVDSISTHEAVEPSVREASLLRTPALLTRMSMPESGQRLLMIFGSARTSASLVTSSTMGRKLSRWIPRLSTSACSFSSCSRRRAMATTRTLDCSSSVTVLHPMPDEAPVTTATFCAQSMDCSAGEAVVAEWVDPACTSAHTFSSDGPGPSAAAASAESSDSAASPGPSGGTPSAATSAAPFVSLLGAEPLGG
mmetsp:Transcript_8125/g.20737  ORF Transcript_8125/g.20737 Transcript_8125/m.20737 type:complete len:220 (+) Transcript_8125:451-1110(+)